MAQPAPERPVGDQSDPFWGRYAAYLNHVQPIEPVDASPCPVCLAGSTPDEGCEEGRRLWGAYRLARIGKVVAL